MSLNERIESLRAKHASLKAMIESENQRPHPDDLEITKLKREKLRIKDEIATLTH